MVWRLPLGNLLTRPRYDKTPIEPAINTASLSILRCSVTIVGEQREAPCKKMVDRKTLKKRIFGKTGSVISMLILTTSFFLVEIIVGYVTNSMALVADSFHMLSDVMSLIVGFVALRYSKRSERTDRNTFGWQRAEVLGALVNAVFLIALCFSILVESLKRIVEPEHISKVVLVLSVGAAGLFINLVGLAMFHRHGHGHSHGGGGGHSHGKQKGKEQNGKSHEDSSREGICDGSVHMTDCTYAVLYLSPIKCSFSF